MKIIENVSLKEHSTMRLGGNARYYCEVKDMFELKEAVEFADSKSIDAIMIGIGSNIIWQDSGYPGLVIVSNIKNYEVNQSLNQVFITVGSGDNWDEVVAKTVESGLSGLEHLSLIPGTAGGTPIQNVGAYGGEISQTLTSLQAYDRELKDFITLSNADCEFGYRTSRFKGKDKGRFFIFSITFSLSKDPPRGPFYASLDSALKKQNITRPTSADIRREVINIRTNKLPDPKQYPNCGSFFANPIIELDQLREIKEDYPKIKYWELPEGNIKVSAAWLIEAIGLKGYVEKNTGMRVWDKQPLILVNDHATTTAQLVAFRDAVVDKIKNKFEITLTQEPEII
ncbi:UDP-N-acetylenolpyruvoylglucosamine reductase [Candidatus Saccharibacteria bacterium RIFCSPHIGHO2_12_FULL_41_12]|nr:MAG: UDP-N-acetylenolpyruvoylglucosamine reductase [Candidatus Saccharibacteria bacterium RIFCSPHIGHO2_12_FULL_41_12]